MSILCFQTVPSHAWSSHQDERQPAVARMDPWKAFLAHLGGGAHLEEGVLLTGRPAGGRQGWPNRCLELGVLCKEGIQGADAGAKTGLHLDEGTQPPGDLPLGPLILHAKLGYAEGRQTESQFGLLLDQAASTQRPASVCANPACSLCNKGLGACAGIC